MTEITHRVYVAELTRLIEIADRDAKRFDFTPALLAAFRAGWVARHRRLGAALTTLAKHDERDPVRDALIGEHPPITKGTGT